MRLFRILDQLSRLRSLRTMPFVGLVSRSNTEISAEVLHGNISSDKTKGFPSLHGCIACQYYSLSEAVLGCLRHYQL